MADYRRGRVSGPASPGPTETRHVKRTGDLAAISLHPSTAKQYSKETLNVLRRLFTERDLEKDGILNSEELEQCLQIVGFCPTPADIEFLTKHFDTNGDGVLQIEELLENIHIIQAHSIHKSELMDAFEKFDTNNDGYIRLPEMLKILTINNFMSVEDARALLTRLIQKYDHNGDGKFSYAEFVEAVMTEGKMSEDLIGAPTLH